MAACDNDLVCVDVSAEIFLCLSSGRASPPTGPGLCGEDLTCSVALGSAVTASIQPPVVMTQAVIKVLLADVRERERRLVNALPLRINSGPVFTCARDAKVPIKQRLKTVSDGNYRFTSHFPPAAVIWEGPFVHRACYPHVREVKGCDTWGGGRRRKTANQNVPFLSTYFCQVSAQEASAGGVL